MKYLEYKGYSGSIEYSEEDGLLYGQVLGIRGLISYEGETGKELEKDVRIPSKLHQKAALLAIETKVSLNSLVAESIRSRVMKGT